MPGAVSKQNGGATSSRERSCMQDTLVSAMLAGPHIHACLVYSRRGVVVAWQQGACTLKVGRPQTGPRNSQQIETDTACSL